MILSCPSCATRYQADPAGFLPAGRNVRCAKCGHVWFEPAPAPQAEPEGERIIAAPVSAPLPSEDKILAKDVETAKPAIVRAFRVPVAGGLAWILLAALIAAIGFSFLRYREVIAVYWPQSASFYSLIGMPVNIRGLAFTDIHYSTKTDDGQPVLAVDGKLVNNGAQTVPVPQLMVQLLDDRDREIYRWNFDPGVTQLAAGAQAPFTTSLANPPRQARNLQIRFADVDAPK